MDYTTIAHWNQKISKANNDAANNAKQNKKCKVHISETLKFTCK